MLKKTEIEILRIFTESLDSKKTIKEISDALKKHYPLIHRTIMSLVKDNYLLRDEHNLLSLNLKNYSEIAYIEGLKAKEFLKKNKKFEKILDGIETDFFALVISGKDTIIIVEDKGDFKPTKGIKIILRKEVAESLSKTREDNLMNKTLNGHVILFGAENYYRMVDNAR